MTDYLESRLPLGDTTDLKAGIESLRPAQVNDLERWLQRAEEALERRVELLDVHLQKQGRGFEASFQVGLAFLE